MQAKAREPQLTTARLLLRRWRESDRALEQMVSLTSVRNARSRTVMERSGMTRDPHGDFAHPLIAGDSPLSAQVLYRLTVADWRAQAPTGMST